MALVCCLDPAVGCVCEKDKVCGGIHIINISCPVHSHVQCRSAIHEVGQRRIEVVKQ